MDYGKLTHLEVEKRIQEAILLLQKARCRDITSLTNDEVVEEGLWLLLKVNEKIEELVKDIDPDRFGPVRAYSIQNQELNKNRLNTCIICGYARCTSDHK